MTKSKAQKARAKAANKGQNQQRKQKKKPAARKQRRRQRRENMNGDEVDNSQTRGGNGGEMTQKREAKVSKPLIKVELIQLVNGSVGFSALKFPINPGLAGTFPIGSTEAKNYTDWKMKYMKVDFIPTVSPFATQGQQGEVVIAVDYNADNAVPTAMNQVEDMNPAGGGIPSKGFSFSVVPRLANKSDPKYVRLGAVPASDDLRLYDGGNLYFATSGCTNATQIGKLMVSYSFEMSVPTLLNIGAAGLAGTSAGQFVGISEAGGATTAAYQVLAATATGNAAFVNTAGSIVPPAGNYQVTVSAKNVFTGAATVATNFLLKNGVTVGYAFGGVFASGTIPTVTSASVFLVNANGTDAFTLSNNATFTTGTNVVSATLVFVPV